MGDDTVSPVTMDEAWLVVRHRLLLERIFIADRIDNLLDAAREHGALLTLVGSCLGDYWDNKQPESTHVTLLSQDWTGDLQAFAPISLVLDCLQEHDYDKESCEATIKSSDIVVNLWEWATRDGATVKRNVVHTMLQQESDLYHTCVLYLDKDSMPEDDVPWWSLRQYTIRPPTGYYR
ncbi:hypothetical protein BT67DRAFT_456431 [Trichocladium antarcticum]|uniref:Uncharacterized protein n=1 Tax=Trichocladium antarcticum TaxID=1450529 RepID=A0AAN6UJ62_9PEZI|nr:hypothetical protein BT67DRAFT_456431 [Trichocladium antarcticum]